MSDDPHTYRTKTGRVLTDTDVEALAAEAESGYDIAALERRPGRPPMGLGPATVVPVRLHASLLSAVKAQATVENTSLSEFVRDAVRRYLATEPTSLDELSTASGHRLSNSEMDALAGEAEAGYDASSVRGRPNRRNRGRAEVVPVRMPPELRAAVEHRAETESTSVSEIVREALKVRLGAPERRHGRRGATRR